jgi:PilZ domain
MTEAREQRVAPRTRVVGRPAARVQGMREVRLLDLSLTGAQIEYLDLFRLGAPCALALPPPFGALSLPAQVVWCTVIGRQRTPGGESHLLARSGLRFTTLTVGQHAALADTLQHLAAALQPIA